MDIKKINCPFKCILTVMKTLLQVCKIPKQKKYNVIIFDIKRTLAGNKQNIITMAI